MTRYTINGQYEGYIWMGDQPSPKIYNEATKLAEELDESSNPFIVEAQLFDKSSNVSKSVRYVDGHYIIVDTDLNTVKSDSKIEDLEFIPSFSGASNLLFKRIWCPKEDQLCQGYFVLEPSRDVFVGFKHD